MACTVVCRKPAAQKKLHSELTSSSSGEKTTKPLTAFCRSFKVPVFPILYPTQGDARKRRTRPRKRDVNAGIVVVTYVWEDNRFLVVVFDQQWSDHISMFHLLKWCQLKNITWRSSQNLPKDWKQRMFSYLIFHHVSCSLVFWNIATKNVRMFILPQRVIFSWLCDLFSALSCFLQTISFIAQQNLYYGLIATLYSDELSLILDECISE